MYFRVGGIPNKVYLGEIDDMVRLILNRTYLRLKVGGSYKNRRVAHNHDSYFSATFYGILLTALSFHYCIQFQLFLYFHHDGMTVPQFAQTWAALGLILFFFLFIHFFQDLPIKRSARSYEIVKVRRVQGD